MRNSDLIDCPKCGAGFNRYDRQGPTVLKYSDREYRGICLNCWHKGKKARTSKRAVELWNAGENVLGEQIRSAREILGLSQGDLAELSKLHIETIGRAERGEVMPTRQTIKKLQKVIDLKGV